MKDNIYTGFSNYKEYNEKSRIDAFNDELDKWGDKKENFKKYRSEWNKAATQNYSPPKPLAVDIELSDACNLKCVFCAHGIGTMNNVGFMDDDSAKKLIDECASLGVHSIKFNWRGEAGINPFLPEAIKYAKDKGILEISMNTNGLPKDKDILIECVKSGLDRIIFSVDGHSSETYEKVRIKGNYKQLKENILRLLEFKKSNNLTKPFVRIQMVRSNINAHEVEDFIEFWGSRVDDVRISDVMDRGQGKKLAVGDQVTVGRTRCPQPFQRLIIARDGRVSPCCGDWTQDLVVGDVSKSSILDIWNGKKLQDIRKLQTDVKLDEFEPCKSCYIKESYVWENKND